MVLTKHYFYGNLTAAVVKETKQPKTFLKVSHNNGEIHNNSRLSLINNDAYPFSGFLLNLQFHSP